MITSLAGGMVKPAERKKMAHKKYSVDYVSGATGYGWSIEYNRLDEFEGFINEMRHEYTAAVRVWDYSLKQFIFWKDCLEWKPSIDLLHSVVRDMRTTDRKIKR